jgi:TPR repeat protein
MAASLGEAEQQQAFELLTFAANSGFAPAIYRLAFLQLGTPDPEIARNAVGLLTVAGQTYGYAPALSQMLLLMLQGGGVDPEQGIQALTQLANEGTPEAQFHLGVVLSPMGGLKEGRKDAAKAVQVLESFLQKEGIQAEMEIGACRELAKLYEGVAGVPRNDAQKEAVLARAIRVAQALGVDLTQQEDISKAKGSESGWNWLIPVMGAAVVIAFGIAITHHFLRIRKRGA